MGEVGRSFITIVKIHGNVLWSKYAKNSELNAVWSDFNPDIIHSFDIFDNLINLIIFDKGRHTNTLCLCYVYGKN